MLLAKRRVRVKNASKRKPVSPLKADPSRTYSLRKRFERAFRVRFARLKKAVIELVAIEDAFGLKPEPPNPFSFNEGAEDGRAGNRTTEANSQQSQNHSDRDVHAGRSHAGKNLERQVTNTRWKFRTTSEQLKAFEDWLKTQIDTTVLPSDGPDAYWYAFIQESYAKGTGRAFDDLHKGAKAAGQNLDFYNGTRAQFLNSAFNNPASVEQVKLLAGRVYTDLKGVTEAMAGQMKRQLVDGMIQGANPRDIARQMAATIDGIGIRRAETIARTETMRAHAEAQIDAFEKLGVKDLGVAVEWSTAGDGRVCERCLPMQGAVFSLQESRGMLPRHPNCRCVFLPANVGEPKQAQTREKPALDAAVKKSLAAETPKAQTVTEARAKSRWLGAGKRIAKDRPESILDKVREKTASETFGPSRAKVIHPDYKRKEINKAVERVLGKDRTLQDVASMVGAPKDATVSVSPGGLGTIDVWVNGPGYTAQRRIIRDLTNGEVTIKNEWFQVTDKGKGQGAKIFAHQVEQAASLGIKSIKTLAAGNPSDTTLNGYYTWARLGYDAPLPKEIIEKLPEGLKGAERVSDLMQTPEGREWWKKNGGALFMEFTTKPGSLSRRILDAYLKEKGIITENQDEALPNADGVLRFEVPPRLTPHDERILDAIWDRIRKA